ncbi:hypothetical protein [Lysinibacillus capsici]
MIRVIFFNLNTIQIRQWQRVVASIKPPDIVLNNNYYPYKIIPLS